MDSAYIDSNAVKNTSGLTQGSDHIISAKRLSALSKSIRSFRQRSEMSPAQKRIADILDSIMYQYIMGIIILFNMIVIIVETDKSAANELEGQVTWSGFAGWIILLLFIVELLLRLFVDRSNFWEDSWNKFDFVVVACDTTISLASILLGGVLSFATLRVFRLCRLARASQLLRVIPELRLMVAGLIGSAKAIFWGTGLLAFAIVVWAIIAVQMVHPVNQRVVDKGFYDDCERCARAYSSVWSATITICQTVVAGDSWGRSAIPLIEHQPMVALYFLGVFLTVGMAVLNLILGVVVNVACSESDHLKEEIEDEKRFEKMEAQKHLLEICINMDADGSGELSKEELMEGYQRKGDFREAVSRMELQDEDLEILWTILDIDRSGTISYKEFVSQVYKIRSSDTEFMLSYIKYYVTIIKDRIVKQMKKNHDALWQSTSLIEEKLNAMVDAPAFGCLARAEASSHGGNSEAAGEMPWSQSDTQDKFAQVNLQATGEKILAGGQLRQGMTRNSTIFSYTDFQAWKVTMDEFRQLLSDLRNAMQDPQRNHEWHMSDTSKLLPELLPLNSRRASPWNISMCGKQRSPVKPEVASVENVGPAMFASNIFL